MNPGLRISPADKILDSDLPPFPKPSDGVIDVLTPPGAYRNPTDKILDPDSLPPPFPSSPSPCDGVIDVLTPGAYSNPTDKIVDLGISCSPSAVLLINKFRSNDPLCPTGSPADNSLDPGAPWSLDNDPTFRMPR